jgi:hypothetical protein
MEKNTYTVFISMLNLEMTKRTEASELNHFIGNVAHDLKVSTGCSESVSQWLLGLFTALCYVLRFIFMCVHV